MEAHELGGNPLRHLRPERTLARRLSRGEILRKGPLGWLGFLDMKAMRREAAKHGADAIFIESQSESSGWKFSGGPLGASGGSVKDVAFRAKAIVWR